MKHNSNTFIEILPSLIFVAVYNLYDLQTAIKSLIATTLIALAYAIYKNKKLPWILLSSFLLLAIFGGLTLYSGDPFYIKIKPTVIYCIFSAALFLDSIFNFGIINKMLLSIATFSEKTVQNFARHSSYFFLFLAIINEVVWRNFSEQNWVLFKAFAFPALNTVFFTTYLLRIFKKENVSLR